MKIDVMKKERGAISTLVLFTVLMFAIILIGVYLTITAMQKGQLKSDMRIADLYGGDVDKVDRVYDEIKLNYLKAGDYIKYDSGENGEIICRVLYEASSEYGLQIISDKNISTVTLEGSSWQAGKTTYNNLITTLNSEAEKYLNTLYATDARCVGSLPTLGENGKMIDKNKGTETTVILPPSQWDSYTRPSGWTSDDTGCYDTDKNYQTDWNTLKTIGISNTGESYWLASRYVYLTSTSSSYCFRRVTVDGILSNNDLCVVMNGRKYRWCFN